MRVARTAEGGLAVGRTLPGRGAWLHRSRECLEMALQKGAFSRALRAPVGEFPGVCEDGEFKLQETKGLT